jgi:hypothetical protein
MMRVQAPLPMGQRWFALSCIVDTASKCLHVLNGREDCVRARGD